MAEISELRLRQGRFITDCNHRQSLVVVGVGIAQALSVGKCSLRPEDLLRVDNYLFTVIDMAESFQALISAAG